jgi:hypothetical protein
MGSTTFGVVNPAGIGFTAPTEIEIDRGSHGRVSMLGRA